MKTATVVATPPEDAADRAKLNDSAAEAWSVPVDVPNPLLNRVAVPIIMAAVYLIYCDLFAPLHPPYQVQQAPQPTMKLPDVMVEMALPQIRADSRLFVQGGCELEPKLRSMNSPAVVQVTFVNSGNAPVAIYWIDFQGRRQQAANLAPGEKHAQRTFAGHPWILADAAGTCQVIVAIAMPRQQAAP